jgi:hypothetical protein
MKSLLVLEARQALWGLCLLWRCPEKRQRGFIELDRTALPYFDDYWREKTKRTVHVGILHIFKLVFNHVNG